MSRTPRRFLVVLTTASLIAPATGCQTKAGTGAIAGGVGGALVGGAIGNNRGSHNGASGAAIGGVVGALGGAAVGHSMDKSDQRKAEEQRQREQAAMRQSQPTYNSNYAPSPTPTKPTSTLTRGDVVDWTRQGVKDEIIIDRIQRSGQQFIITSADERELKSLGVRDNVITAMKNTSR
jgi:uncharacterized protein YcfJ